LITWNQVASAGRNIEIQRSQLGAARTYYEGTLEEYRAGLRSTFDVLYAQNNLRDTQIAFLASRHDHYVAQSALLRQLGLLEVRRLLARGARYDPQDHVNVVERRGALPWDGLIRQFDAFAKPTQKPLGLEQPFAGQSPAKIVPSEAGAPMPDSIERRSLPRSTKAAGGSAP
jgi:outer membrane protein